MNFTNLIFKIVAPIDESIGIATPPPALVVAPTRSLHDIFAFLPNYFLALAASATFVALVVSGIFWITAAGDEEKIARAKNVAKFSMFGLAVVGTASTLVAIVLRLLV